MRSWSVECSFLYLATQLPTVWATRSYEAATEEMVRSFSMTSRTTCALNSPEYLAAGMVSILWTHGKKNSPSPRNTTHPRPVMGYACVHSVINDYSRVVYSEIHDDEKADTAVGVLQRAVSWFSARGVKVERVLSDNGSAYRSQAWQAACQQLGIKAKHTRPYRPQTNGKIERFHRTLADGWAYARHYTSETQRRQALPAWLHLYNHHRPHTATQGHPPITRLTNLPDQYSQVAGLSDRGEAECYPHDEVADRSEAGAQGRHHRCHECQHQEDDPLRNDRVPQSQHEDEVRRPEDRRYRDVQPGLG